MKLLLVLVGLLAFSAAQIIGNYDVDNMTNDDWENFMQDDSVTPENRGLILNGQAKKAVKNLLQQMPCGFPERGIPPLAPYYNEELKFHIAKSAVDALLQIFRFRFDGLDQMKIKKLKVSYTFSKKVRFHFQFQTLRATSPKWNANTFLDFMQQLGVSVRYEGAGPMEFALHNLEIQGQFKYKMPFIFGSIKIYKFECKVSLGGVTSNIGGLLGNGALNELINDEIEAAIPAFINDNEKEISARIEAFVVPTVNTKLKGHKIWSLLGQLGNSNSKCVPPPAPWAEN